MAIHGVRRHGFAPVHGVSKCKQLMRTLAAVDSVCRSTAASVSDWGRTRSRELAISPAGFAICARIASAWDVASVEARTSPSQMRDLVKWRRGPRLVVRCPLAPLRAAGGYLAGYRLVLGWNLASTWPRGVERLVVRARNVTLTRLQCAMRWVPTEPA